MIGRIYYIQGNLGNAYLLYLICFDEALICENQPLVTKALHRLSMVECCMGFVHESLGAFELMSSTSNNLTGRRKSFILYRIAKCLYLTNDYERAIQVCKEAIVIKQSFNDLRGIVFVQKLLSKIFLKRNDIAESKIQLEKAVSLLDEVNIIKEEIAVKLIMAKIHIKCAEHKEAAELLNFCLEESSRLELKFRIETIQNITKEHEDFECIYNRSKELCEIKNSESEDLGPAHYFANLLSNNNRQLIDNLFIKGKSNLKAMLYRVGFA
jgi:tetratricopeptide (TPR) repeat protein